MRQLIRSCLLLALLAPGMALHAQPAADEARLKQELERAEQGFGAGSDAAAAARRELIRHYRAQYRPADALPLLRAELEQAVSRYGADSEEANDARYSIGSTLISAGFAHEALPLLERALAHFRSARGEADRKADNIRFFIGRAQIQTGDFAGAAQTLEQVLAFRNKAYRQWHPQIAHAEYRLGAAYWRLGRFADAERLLNSALETFRRRKGEEDINYNGVLQELGELYRFKGRFDEAEAVMQKALAENIKSFGERHPTTLYSMQILGQLLFDQRRHAEAEKVTRQLLQLAREILGADSSRSLAALTLLANILNRQNRAADAEPLLREVIEARSRQTGAGSAPVATTRVILGETLVTLGRHREAVEALRPALPVLEQARGERHAATAGVHRWLGSAYRGTGEHALALEHLAKSLAIFDETRGPAFPGSAFILSDMARVHEALKQPAAAAAHYRKALERTSGFLAGRRIQSPAARAEQEESLRGLLNRYLNLLLEAQRSGASLGFDPVAESFAVAENLRGRSLQQAVLGMAARAAARDARLADLVRKEQDLRVMLGAVEQDIVGGLGTGRAVEERGSTKDLVARRREMERELAALGAAIEHGFPDYGRLMNPSPATAAEAAAVLRPKEALLVYLTRKDHTLLWTVSRERSRLHRLPLGEKELAAKVKLLRRSLDISAETLKDIPPYNVKLAQELHALLLGPAAAELAENRHLIVVPHGPLLSLPFPALVGGGDAGPRLEGIPFSEYRALPWLAATHAMTVVPSATTLVTLRRHAKGGAAPRPFVGFGNPAFGAAPAPAAPDALIQRRAADAQELAKLAPLPETGDELKAIAASLGLGPDGYLYLGRDASEETVKRLPLGEFRVVAFATHGLIAGDLEGLVEPALALSAPEQRNGGNDGLLTMSEVLGLRLDADWVILSACNTAAPDGTLGGEGLTGLAQAFFYAGSRALLVTLWAVETHATRRLTTALFSEARGNPALTRAEALAAARLALIRGPGHAREGKEVFSYAHPLFWAAFMLVGEGAQ